MEPEFVKERYNHLSTIKKTQAKMKDHQMYGEPATLRKIELLGHIKEKLNIQIDTALREVNKNKRA